MHGFKDEAAEYRKEAASCMQVAERLSVNADKQRMIDMALHWLKLAEEADARHGYQSLSGKDREV